MVSKIPFFLLKIKSFHRIRSVSLSLSLSLNEMRNKSQRKIESDIFMKSHFLLHQISSSFYSFACAFVFVEEHVD